MRSLICLSLFLAAASVCTAAEDELAFDTQLVQKIAKDAMREGDPARGREVFFSKNAGCQTCHRVGEIGGMAGPNLVDIGKARSSEEIVESLLWPSRKVETKFSLSTLVTTKGEVREGYVIAESTKQLVLKEPATGTIRKISRGDIVRREDGGTLMPKGLAEKLERRELLDLVRFLKNRIDRTKPVAPTRSRRKVISAPKGFESVDFNIELSVVPENMRYDKHWLRVAPGSKVQLTLRNIDRMQHNWLLCAMSENSATQVAKLAGSLGSEAVEKNYTPKSDLVLESIPIVNPGESATIYFRAPTEEGDYPYVCTLPGHAAMMRGVLYVGPEKKAPPPPAMHKHEFPASAVVRASQKMQEYWHYTRIGNVFSCILSFGGKTSKIYGSRPEFKTPTFRGIAIRVGDKSNAAIAFDSDLMRYSAAWSGSFIDLHPNRKDEHAEYRHAIAGEIAFANPARPGWARGDDWDFRRPRGYGPLPDDWARYRGRFQHGDRCVLHYTVGGVDVLDAPWVEGKNSSDRVFTRTLRVDSSRKAKKLLLAEELGSTGETIQHAGLSITRFSSESRTPLLVAILGDAAIVKVEGERCVATIPPNSSATRFKVFIARSASLEAFARVVRSSRIENIERWTLGGPAQAPQEIITRGKVGAGNGPFVVDTLTLPYDNPWNALLYVGGHDFFSNGDAAICTSHGDVWRASGIDADLNRLVWRRIASGLVNPLGLKIVNDEIYVTCLDQIAKLQDLNGDLEIDRYESFNNDCQVSDSHHRFATGLETDSKGNFYHCKCSDEGRTDHGGSLIRVSPTGDSFELFATGLRNPNGLGIGPDDTITFSKQQGGWIPSTGIHVVKRGGYYGYTPSHHRAEAPSEFEKPLCWIPHGIDNSGGGQVWIPSKAEWGPLKGKLIHLSYGKCQAFLVLRQQVGELQQGGVVRLPGLDFESGAMRGRFSKQDGHLYISGLRGWQTSGAMPGCLQRVRYTGKNLNLPVSLIVTQKGISLRFSSPLKASQAQSPESWIVSRWQYRWTKNYGSPDYSIDDPNKKGRDPAEVVAVRVSDDGYGVDLELKNHRSAQQMLIRYQLETADGQKFTGEIANTIHSIPGRD